MIDVAVIGAGAVGLTMAARLAQHGASVELFEASEARARMGSRAICMQRETLEIWARLGVGERVAERGVRWRIGRTYHRGRELFHVELPGSDEHFPPFVNISQSEVEELLEGRALELGVQLHRGHRLVALSQDASGIDAVFETPHGELRRRASFLVGTDGAHSTVRHAAGIDFPGSTFEDRFLIADVRAQLPFANERHFHFSPPWNPGRQVLIHPQPDGIWRIDWQVPAATDPATEAAGDRLDGRIRAVIGERTPYEVMWSTAYRFSQRVAARFRAGRAFLAGDAAHVMSPFGARGLNSGVADAENLAWKLALVLSGEAPATLLDSYEAERRPAALANLAATSATMRFMAPHGPLRRAWRDLVLRMAPHSAWFRGRVDSGRLAEPAVYEGSPIVAPGEGAVAPDLRLVDGRRLRDAVGRGFVVVAARPIDGLETLISLDASLTGHALVVRPDGHVADRVPLGLAAAVELARRLAHARGGPA